MQSIHALDQKDYHKIPIILLDYSGSVMTLFDNDKRVIDHLVDMIKETAKQDNFQKAHLIMWSSFAEYCNVIDIANIDINNIINNLKIKSDCTYLVPALKEVYKIHDRIAINNVSNNIVPLYIFTDGEIGDSEIDLIGEIKYLLGNNIDNKKHLLHDLRMIVVEPNEKNYFTNNCAAGNILVEMLRNISLSEKIKYIFFINRRYRSLSDRFVNVYNATLPADYIQHDDKCFHIKNYPIFLADLTKEITDLRTKITVKDVVIPEDLIPKEDMLDDVIDDMNDIENEDIHIKHGAKEDPILGRLEKIGYNLIKTIRDLEKALINNKKFNKRQLIDFFCNMIGIDEITDFLKRELIYGIDNKTFQEYKERRGKLFNDTQINMYKNLQKTICSEDHDHYTSFLDNGCIYDITTDSIEHSINIGFREYKRAGVYDSQLKRLVPILPIFGNYGNKSQMKQSLRQWIRAIYSKKFGIPASSDLIHYTFLLDNLYIQCSDVPKHIKSAYQQYALIMLDRVRYGESIKEIDYLRRGERPKPIGSNIEFGQFLENCPNFINISNDDNLIDPMTVWYMILCVLDDTTLNSAQEKHCINLINDGLISKKNKNLVSNVKEFINNRYGKIRIECKKLKLDQNIVTPNYYCFITLNDTEETGGYMIYTHRNNENHDLKCKPNYVISKEAYDSYSKKATNSNVSKNISKNISQIVLRCPYCSAEIDTNRMIVVEPKKEYEQREDVIKRNKETTKIYRKVEIYDNFSNDLIKLNELDFAMQYNHKVFFKEHIVLCNPMDNYSVMKFKTKNKQTEFNKKVPSFLLKLDWSNIIVAGGMCRSILLGQKIQDIDIFFVGLNEDSIKNRIIQLINDIVTSLQSENSDYVFILMYKPLNSVVELLCTKSTFDDRIINDNDDIDVNEKYLFIHNEVIHKVQIILRSHEDIRDVFYDFDMHASCVAFDGKRTFFNEASFVAYKYMINMVDNERSKHVSYDHRIMKYYNYGFSVALDKKQLSPELIEHIESTPKLIKISGCVFEPIENSLSLDKTEENVDLDHCILLNCFRLVKKNEFTTDKLSQNNELSIGTNLVQEVMKGPAMYENYDSFDANMIGLYNYMTDNNIRYCYVMGVIDEEQLLEVFDVDDIEFLRNKRDVAFNWYDISNIVISNS